MIRFTQENSLCDLLYCCRHNILLDTPEARAAAKDLHKKAATAAKEQQEQMDAEATEEGDEGEEDSHPDVPDSVTAEGHADLDHYGDDEGDDEEDMKGDEEMFD